MKLIFILLLSFITFSNCKLVKRVYYGGVSCDGKISRVDIMSLCSYKQSITIDLNKITYHERNLSQPYNCDETSFDSTGVVFTAQECKAWGTEASYVDTILDGFTVETALSSVPEGSCNDFVYVDTECTTNFYMSTFLNNSCYPMYYEKEDVTAYMKVTCDKETFTSSVYLNAKCADGAIASEKSPYSKASCQKAISDFSGIYHSYTYKPVSNTPAQHNEVDALDPNNSIKVIPSILLIVSFLLSLFL